MALALPVAFVLAAGLAALGPILLTISSGLQTINPIEITVARSLAAEPLETVNSLLLPIIRPNLLASRRAAVGLIWVALVPAERRGVSSGLGDPVLFCRAGERTQAQG